MSYVCPELAQANDFDLQGIVGGLNNHAQRQVPPDPNAPYFAPPEAQRGEHGANVVKLLNNQERLFFFHVDTCLAIIFILDNGMVIGGHAGMVLPEELGGPIVLNGFPQMVLQDMQLLIPDGANIVTIHLVGDIEGFHRNINAIIAENIPNVHPIPIIPHQHDNVPINVVVSHHLAGWHIDILPYELV